MDALDAYRRALTGDAREPRLTLERRYRAGREDLWRALTAPDSLARWLGRISPFPTGPGAEFDCVMGEDDAARLRLVECEPPHRLVCDWLWPGEPASVLTAELREGSDGATLLRLTHALGSADLVAEYGGGWEDLLDALASAVTGDQDRRWPADRSAALWGAMADRVVDLTRELPASPAEVWAAFADAEGLKSWWWSHWDDVTVEADVRPGGRYAIAAPSAGIELTGEYLSVDPGRHIAFTWAWRDADSVSTDEAVEISLDPSGSGTLLRVRHTGPWASDEPAVAYRQGWEFTLGQLASRKG